MNEASIATAEVGFELFRHLTAAIGRTDNVFISTYGILSALSMLLLGTKDSTEREIASLLKIKGDDSEAYHQSLFRLASAMASPSLTSANKLFVQRNLSLVPSFLSAAQRLYASGADQADFSGSPSEAQAEINEWVKTKTGGKIPHLLGQPLDPSTLVFLVNAVYFKDKWGHPFQAENTYSGTFHVSAEESVKCDMMTLTENTDEIRHGNSDELDCQLLELPYEGDFSMLIIMPFVAETLPDVEKKLNDRLIRSEMKNLESSPGMGPEIYMPRFKIEYEIDLEESLKAMGVVSVFDYQLANLSGMINPAANVALSKVVHKAVVEVDEEGTVAAAATGMGINFMCMPPQIRMDHPFLFVIVHRPTDTPIFVGRMSRPSPATVDL